MSDASAVPPREGHPPGLYMLFFAEMWERFCFYGMRALLTLYMVSEVFSYDDAQATAVYGSYNALIYLRRSRAASSRTGCSATAGRSCSAAC